MSASRDAVRAGAVGLATAMLMVGAGGDAQAQGWDFGGAVSLTQSYSDNANAVPRDENPRADFITRITPSVSVRRQSRRTSLAANYSVSGIRAWRGTQGDQIRQALTGVGSAELWERIAFVDTRASISQQVTSSREFTSDSEAGQLFNRSEVRSASIRPMVRYGYRNFAVTETSVSFDGVSAEDTASSYGYNARFVAQSGRQFVVTPWTLSLRHGKTFYRDVGAGETGGNTENTDADFSARYIINRQLSLVGSVGYEIIRDRTLDDDEVGPTWRAGVNYRPTPRTALNLTYGRSAGRQSFDFSARHQLTVRTSLFASYNETIQTSQQRILADLRFIAFDFEQGAFIDLRTGQPIPPGIAPGDVLGVQRFASYTKSGRAGVSGTRGRNRFSGSLHYTSRETDETDETETSLGGTATFGRQLTRRTDGLASIGYTRTEFDSDGRKQHDVRFLASLRYRIFRDVSSALSYTHVRRYATGSARTVENAVAVTVTKTF